MAYLNPSKWDEEQQRQQAAAAPQQPELGSAPAAPASAAAGTAPAQSPQQSTAPTTNSFPGISAYLNANQGQGEKIGEQLDKSIGSELGQAQSDFAKGEADWQSQNQGAIDAWTKAVQDAQAQNRNAYDTQLGQVNNWATNWAKQPRDAWTPSYFWKIPNEMGSWNAPTAGSIPTGPSVGAYSPWTSGLQSGHAAADQLNALNSDAGRQSVLGQIAGPGYSQGMGALDSALLGASGAPANLSAKYAGILSKLQGSESPADITKTDTSAYGDQGSRQQSVSYSDLVRQALNQIAAQQEEDQKKMASQPQASPFSE